MSARTDSSWVLNWSMPMVIALALGFFLLSPAYAQETVYVLFRHAEKARQSPDPGLTAYGQERAVALGSYLQQAGVTRIFSTDYTRTRETVEPLSAATGIEIEFYDPRDLEGFADQLKGMSGTIAISGHSNTTPELAALISGQATEPMSETEFGRLYTVIRKKNGTTTLNVSQRD